MSIECLFCVIHPSTGFLWIIDRILTFQQLPVVGIITPRAGEETEAQVGSPAQGHTAGGARFEPRQSDFRARPPSITTAFLVEAAGRRPAPTGHMLSPIQPPRRKPEELVAEAECLPSAHPALSTHPYLQR